MVKSLSMKKINLLNETIAVSNEALCQALISNKEFSITINGEIKYPPFEPTDILIYHKEVSSEDQSEVNLLKDSNAQELLGPDYHLEEENDSILIKAGNAWDEIINYNIHNSHYHDLSGEGVNEFSDQKIEDMGWMLIDFDTSYKEILAFLEENTDITVICIEQEAPYQSSSMGYFDDIEEAQKTFYDFCQTIIKDKLANDPDFTYDYLDEDQQEAVAFFNAR